MIEALVSLLIWLIVLGLIYYLAQMAINALPIAEPAKGIARVILLVIIILVIIYMLVGFLPAPRDGLVFPHR